LDSGGVGGGGPDGPVTVDIVVNNHNYAEYLPAAIESARVQDHPGVNVIVVDDGSTDGSREGLRAFEDSVDVVLKENGGQASALNAGFDRCRGDAVIFLDADDTLRPDAASRVAAAFAADPEVVKVQFRLDVIDADGRPTGVIKPPPHLGMPSGDLRRAELAAPFDQVWMATSGNAFRRRALERILPIPEREYPRCADYYLVHLTALLGRVVSIEDVAGSYRVHGRNAYEPQAAEVDLAHVRDSITYAATTAPAIAELADRLGIERPDPLLSVSDLGNRLISLRLEPGLHPIPADSRRSLLGEGLRAARRRFDVSAAMRLMFAAWFAAIAVAPRALARRLAELFLFPERRGSLNRLVGRMHR
jgi:cellulose synthase/poly-beta-1,6-N-acetylglucosamine synthase-like glycosyltransferase